MEKFTQAGTVKEVMETIEAFAQHEHEQHLEQVGNNWDEVSNED